MQAWAFAFNPPLSPLPLPPLFPSSPNPLFPPVIIHWVRFPSGWMRGGTKGGMGSGVGEEPLFSQLPVTLPFSSVVPWVSLPQMVRWREGMELGLGAPLSPAPLPFSLSSVVPLGYRSPQMVQWMRWSKGGGLRGHSWGSLGVLVVGSKHWPT